jgi:hypothetical protein
MCSPRIHGVVLWSGGGRTMTRTDVAPTRFDAAKVLVSEVSKSLDQEE